MAVAVRARVLALDYEGLADARSARTILQLVAPRHLVLAQGPPEVCARALIRRSLACLAPRAGDTQLLFSVASCCPLCCASCAVTCWVTFRGAW